MNTIIEIPFFDNSSGGINRIIKLVFELPKFNISSGGVSETVKLNKKFNSSSTIRFQKIGTEYPNIDAKWTIGLPDNTFPDCDVCITYSDNPYLDQLVELPQVKKVLIYMLSYGMSIDRERKNVHNEKVTVMCSTKKIENLILKEGVKVHRVGFALNTDEMYNENKTRGNYLALMYHNSPDKKYDIGVKVANDLYDKGIIDGVITFGCDIGYDKAKHPNSLIKHYPNANRDEIREIFNTCKCFLMPSVTEGLNLTPIESTLCGCPAILCDGAINEIFFDRKNCFISPKNNTEQMGKLVKNIFDNFDKYSEHFRNNMYNVTSKYTWENVIQNIKKLM